MIERILRNTPTTLSVTFTVDEVPTDPDGATANFSALKADGTTHTASTPATRTGVGAFTYSMPSQANLNVLATSWTATMSAQPVTIKSSVEVVGDFYFTISDLRAYEKKFTDNPSIYTYDKLSKARQATEEEFERICHRAFVPRFGRWVGQGDGSKELWLDHSDVYLLTKFTINGVDQLSYQTSGQLRIDRDDTKLLYFTEQSGMTFTNNADIVVEYEHGFKVTPFPIYDKAKKRARMYAMGQNVRTDERVSVISDRDGGRYNMATPGMEMGFGRYTRSSMGIWWIGVPDIDVVLNDFIVDHSGGVV